VANQLTVARPYAKALFDQAVTDDRLEQWSMVLQGLALITADSKMATMYGDPKVTDEVIKELVYDVLRDSAQDAVAGLSDKLKNFLSLLLEEKRLLIAKDINLLYHRLVSAYKKIIEIEIISAMPLDKAQQAAFYKSLEKRFASKVSLEFQQDKSLIGGAVIRSGNWVLDGSIRGKIARLDEILMS
jgi:F-type H+-transporting ATPase subunit delta